MHTSISNQQGVLTVEGAIATKPGEVCEVLRTHNISLCAMSETRWKGSGSIAQEDYVFLFSGLPETAPKSMYGVAFALNTDMQRCWKEAGSYVDYINERMIKSVYKSKDVSSTLYRCMLPHFVRRNGTRRRFMRNSVGLHKKLMRTRN